MDLKRVDAKNALDVLTIVHAGAVQIFVTANGDVSPEDAAKMSFRIYTTALELLAETVSNAP